MYLWTTNDNRKITNLTRSTMLHAKRATKRKTKGKQRTKELKKNRIMSPISTDLFYCKSAYRTPGPLTRFLGLPISPLVSLFLCSMTGGDPEPALPFSEAKKPSSSRIAGKVGSAAAAAFATGRAMSVDMALRAFVAADRLSEEHVSSSEEERSGIRRLGMWKGRLQEEKGGRVRKVREVSLFQGCYHLASATTLLASQSFCPRSWTSACGLTVPLGCCGGGASGMVTSCQSFSGGVGACSGSRQTACT